MAASPWDNITTGKEAARKLNELQNTLEQHAESYSDTALPDRTKEWFNIGWIVKFWAQHANGMLNEAPYDRNLADMLFVVICYAYAITQNKMEDTRTRAHKVDEYETVCKLQQLCMSLPDRSDIDPKAVLDDCVAIVIWKMNPEVREVAKKPRGLGMDYGDAQDEFKGDDEQQLEDLEQAKREEDAKARKRLIDAFLPWCTRLFFETWHARELYTEFKTVQLSDALAEQIQGCRAKFNSWMTKYCAQGDPPADFYKKLKAWTYRQLTGVGTMRNLHREAHKRDLRGETEWPRLIFADLIQTKQPHDKWLRKDKPAEIHDDLKHPLRDTLHLTVFATIFDCTYGTQDAFTKEHVVFRDELLTKAQYIRQDTVDLLQRPPILVQTGARRWQVHFNETWYPAAPVADCLLLWCVLMRAECDSRLLNGAYITDWLKMFL